jgi:hypothetical protein
MHQALQYVEPARQRLAWVEEILSSLGIVQDRWTRVVDGATDTLCFVDYGTKEGDSGSHFAASETRIGWNLSISPDYACVEAHLSLNLRHRDEDEGTEEQTYVARTRPVLSIGASFDEDRPKGSAFYLSVGPYTEKYRDTDELTGIPEAQRNALFSKTKLTEEEARTLIKVMAHIFLST